MHIGVVDFVKQTLCGRLNQKLLHTNWFITMFAANKIHHMCAHYWGEAMVLKASIISYMYILPNLT